MAQGRSVVVSERIRLKIGDVSVPDAIAALKDGKFLLKWCSSGLVKPHRRFFWLDMETIALRWSSPKKPPAKTAMFLSEVRRVAPGEDCDFWRNRAEKEYAIELSGNRKLRLACETVEEWRIWMTGLLHAHQTAVNRRAIAQNFASDFITRQWDKADTEKAGHLTLSKLVNLVHSLNVHVELRHVETLFRKHDTDSSGVLEYANFRNLLEELVWREALQPHFDAYRDEHTQTISIAGYRRFLQDVQLVDEPEEFERSCQQISEFAEPFRDEGGLTSIGFHCLLCSENNSLMRPDRKRCYQDMDRPLCEYWIASSHNTYLTGDQVIGRSAVGQYIDVLLRGCRCVELDCWDGPDGEPVVYHGLGGYALSGRIPFAGVIQACKDYGFQQSRYPIVLSLEMHCSAKQKIRVGQILTDILGDQLYKTGVNGCSVPTPLNCQGKFIVKGKVPDETGETEVEEGNEEDLALQELEMNLTNDISRPANAVLRKSYSSGALRSNHTAKIASSESRTDRSPCIRNEGLQSYYKCITISGCKLKSFSAPRKELDIWSMNETQFTKLMKSNARELMQFQKKQLLRVYPAGMRVTSSNFSPVSVWCQGGQIVALNWQALGPPTIANEGRFSENGGHASGYVLKPPILRNANSTLLGYDDDTTVDNPVEISISVLSAHQLPRPSLDNRRSTLSQRIPKKVGGSPASRTSPSARPAEFSSSPRQRRPPSTAGSSDLLDTCCPFVTVSVQGVRSDNRSYRTTTVMNSGLNPSWPEDQTFVFNVRIPSLAILEFEVRHADGTRAEFLGAAAMPVSAIRQGVRWVSLFDSRFHETLASGILVHVKSKPAAAQT
eukprot:GHVS01077747.1.p1 GENE.GHVS01077747.1~~GHVS01077747.1.p1  ORF type:complete len:836 (-),score=84.50 GHVS01077747.1:98-2605(-)